MFIRLGLCVASITGRWCITRALIERDKVHGELKDAKDSKERLSRVFRNMTRPVGVQLSLDR